ncbi:MAG: PAS domain S-box protein, partial [Desulfovibrionales bacterium]|nr:PAS domain S-box protein [Desulfovibrionales bacterium]
MSRKYFSAPYKGQTQDNALEKLIGLGPRSMQKSYYPELKSKLDELTRFRNLLDNINDLIILIDVTSGNIIDVNKATESLMELSSRKIIGNPLSSIMDSQEAEKIYNFFQQKNICSKIFHTRLTTSLKKLIPVEINCKIVRLKPNGYGVLIARNITDQEQARHEIELQRVFFRQLFDNSPKAIIMSDENFSTVDVNQSFTSLFGYSGNEVFGKDLHDLIIPEGFEHEKDHINNEVYQGRNISLQTRRKTRSGQIIDVNLQCIPVTYAGKFNGFFCTFTDITHKLQMEQDIARQQKLESIALLAGGIAHDFNNILSVILANTSLSKIQTKENPRLLESLQRIENASIRAKDLTQQLLTFARGGEPIKKTFDLEKVLRETVSFALSGSSAKFVLDIKEDLMPVFA